MKTERDILGMSFGKRGRELQRLRALIRTHKRKPNNARCWHTDEQLYDRALPEGSKDAGRMTLPEKVLLRKCKQYIRGQQCDMAKTCPFAKKGE